jgi:tryptophan synthase alpha subunit
MNDTGFQIRALKLMTTNSSKLTRLQNTADYKREFTYAGSTQNVTVIKHTGSTNNGLETVTETFTYENPAVDGSRILSIQIS